jgi:hypothetical protein
VTPAEDGMAPYGEGYGTAMVIGGGTVLLILIIIVIVLLVRR